MPAQIVISFQSHSVTTQDVLQQRAYSDQSYHVLSPQNIRIFFCDSSNTLAVPLRHYNQARSSIASFPSRPMGCCSSTATVPSEPILAPAPLVAETMTPSTVLSQAIVETSPVPSSQPPPSRTGPSFRPKSARHIPTSSQDPSPQSRTKAAPQPRQDLNNSLPQSPRTNAETPSTPEPNNRPDGISLIPGESDA